MMKQVMKKLLALFVCVSLLPAAAFADENEYADIIAGANDGTPVTRSDFELSFRFNADGFPEDGLMHYSDWETLVDKITLRGTMQSQNFPSTDDRVYVDGGVYLKDKLTVPFEYDAYGNLRFISSPALKGDSLFFHMGNFFEFMLKPYKYINLQTQNAALVLYPEAWIKMWEVYSEPFIAALGAEGSRTADYDTLYELCDTLNLIALEDEGNRVYFFATSLMTDLGMTWTALEKLGCWENLLDYLDPDKQGLVITQTETAETWVIGTTTVFEKTVSDDGTAFRIELPDPDGYVFSIDVRKTAEEITAELLILLEGEEYYRLNAGVEGLPAEDDLTAEGTLWADITGDALYQDIAPIRMQFAYERTAQSKPYDLKVDIDFLHPETEMPHLGLSYTASVDEVPATELVQKEYDDETFADFFSLNEMLLSEHIDRFKHTVVLAAAPFALEVPAGVISDVIAFMEYNGLLGLFGIE